jgi:hypothetical protein
VFPASDVEVRVSSSYTGASDRGAVYWGIKARPQATVVAVRTFAEPDYDALIRSVWAESKHDWVRTPSEPPEYTKDECLPFNRVCPSEGKLSEMSHIGKYSETWNPDFIWIFQVCARGFKSLPLHTLVLRFRSFQRIARKGRVRGVSAADRIKPRQSRSAGAGGARTALGYLELFNLPAVAVLGPDLIQILR